MTKIIPFSNKWYTGEKNFKPAVPPPSTLSPFACSVASLSHCALHYQPGTHSLRRVHLAERTRGTGPIADIGKKRFAGSQTVRPMQEESICHLNFYKNISPFLFLPKDIFHKWNIYLFTPALPLLRFFFRLAIFFCFSSRAVCSHIFEIRSRVVRPFLLLVLVWIVIPNPSGKTVGESENKLVFFFSVYGT